MRTLSLSVCLLAAWSAAAYARPWTDSTGHYTIDADLIAYNDHTVVLQRADHELVAVPVDKLSDQDRKYLQSQEAGDIAKRAEGMQTWTLRDGLKVIGKVVDYGRKEITVQLRRGKIFVNDRLYNNLPPVYQAMIPKIVAHFGNPDVTDRQSFAAWLKQQGGQPRTFTVEGVLLELENGDEYGVPFLFFSEEDLAILKPGWDQWVAANEDYDRQSEQSFRLRALAAARTNDRQVQRQIAEMQLNMQAIQAGVTALWEVTLYPGPGTPGPPKWVVGTARDSRQAAALAIEQNPGYVVGPVRRVSG
jgi:hypothetical protein